MSKKASGLPGMGLNPLGTMFDSVEMLRKAWGAINALPNSITPTVDLEELDRRIADLKAVEQWLNMNLGMLRGTIQGMEIQRGTIATLKAFGRAIAPGGEAAGEPARAMTGTGDGGAVPPGWPMPSAAPVDGPVTGPAAEPAEVPAGAAAIDPGLSPAAWWNLLQQQFNTVAAAAMASARAGVKAGQEEAARSMARGRAAKGAARGAAKGAAKGTTKGAGSAAAGGRGAPPARSPKAPANAPRGARSGGKAGTAMPDAGWSPDLRLGTEGSPPARTRAPRQPVRRGR